MFLEVFQQALTLDKMNSRQYEIQLEARTAMHENSRTLYIVQKR